MKKIGIDQIVAAFDVAESVHKGKLTAEIGKGRLVQDYGMNTNSAEFYIYVYKSLVEGVVFKRTLSALSFDYFLGQILARCPFEVFCGAVNALELHVEYLVRKYERASAQQRILSKYQTLVSNGESIERVQSVFMKQVEDSSRLKKGRSERLNAANKTPTQGTAIIRYYRRNPDVVAEVLFRASGICERCGRDAPFIGKSTGLPYLEVHHKVQLAHGGEDTLENAIAVCPNCHRELHFG